MASKHVKPQKKTNKKQTKRTQKKSTARARAPTKTSAARRGGTSGRASKKGRGTSRPGARAPSRVVLEPTMPPVAVAREERRQKRRPLEIVTQASAVQARMMAARANGLTVGFVPTMGALHDGHAALLAEARRRANIVVASVFVNPKQFGPNEDYSRYPRRLEEDAKLCAACGVDILFAPSAEEIYGPEFDTTVRAGTLANELEGAARPGHFDGVLTVVLALFQIVQPHFAIFGEKDYQQLTLIRRMVRDLKITVEVVPMPVIRDVDGLALSSRNAYLSSADRSKATALYRALMAAQDEVQRGVLDAPALVGAARDVLANVEGLEVGYVEVRDPRTLAPVQRLERDARLLLAARLGGIRLIDNGPLFAGVRFP